MAILNFDAGMIDRMAHELHPHSNVLSETEVIISLSLVQSFFSYRSHHPPPIFLTYNIKDGNSAHWSCILF